MQNILEVKGLNKKYEGFSLENINFNIPSGAIVGLVGKNGSGKTTTINSILDITKRDSGYINYFGLNFDENEYKIKERLGVILGDSFFHDSLNPKEINFLMKDFVSSWKEDKFFSYLEKFDLPKEKSINTFSKGMKMKLKIAVSLSRNAKFLILDEPTVGLDPIVRDEILDELLEFIQDEENSILFSTHITTDLDKVADYIIFLDDGKIVFQEDIETLLSEHGILKCSEEDLEEVDISYIVKVKRNKFSTEALIKNKYEFIEKYPDLVVDKVNIEDIMLFYIKGE